MPGFILYYLAGRLDQFGQNLNFKITRDDRKNSYSYKRSIYESVDDMSQSIINYIFENHQKQSSHINR